MALNDKLRGAVRGVAVRIGLAWLASQVRAAAEGGLGEGWRRAYWAVAGKKTATGFALGLVAAGLLAAGYSEAAAAAVTIGTLCASWGLVDKAWRSDGVPDAIRGTALYRWLFEHSALLTAVLTSAWAAVEAAQRLGLVAQTPWLAYADEVLLGLAAAAVQAGLVDAGWRAQPPAVTLRDEELARLLGGPHKAPPGGPGPLVVAFLVVGMMAAPGPVWSATFLEQAEAAVAGSATVLCAGGGGLYACDDPDQAPLCWDGREQILIRCSDLPKDPDGTLKRSLMAVGGNALDILTTGIAVNHGAVEGNPLMPSEEIRWGAKALATVGQIGIQEFVARVLKRPRVATWIARGVLVFYGCVGLHNLDVARKG